MKENKKEDLLFGKSIRIFLFIVLPLLLFYGILNTNLTGFSINNSEQISTTSIVIGSFLVTTTIFFIILLLLIKIRAKAFKPKK